MSPAAFSVRNPVAMNLIMVLCIVFGIYEVQTMVRDFFPDINADRVSITTLYPGAPPEEVEKGITAKIEEAIDTIDGIDEVRSRILEGRSSIEVVLEENANVDRVLADMKQEIDSIADLPDEAEETDVREQQMFIPVINVVVHGNVSERRLRKAAEGVRDQLLLRDEISEVVISGSRSPEISVEVKPGALDRYELSFDDVASAVARANLDLSAGQLKTPLGNTRVRTMGERDATRELEDIVVRADDGGGAIRLGEVATIVDGFEDRVNRGSFQGQRAMSLYVFKAKGEDAIKISQAAKDFAAAAQRDYEGTEINVDTNTDLARFIEGRLSLLTKNALYGLVLVVIALSVFLRLGVAFWSAVGLVVAFLGTFIAMDFMGITINLLSLFGLIIVLGLIVDDAIVIGENIYRRMEMGEPPHVAAVRGTDEVALPVVAAILTTIASFLPLAFIEGQLGDFFSVVPYVVMAALGVSLIEAFCVLPSHMAEFVRVRPPDESSGTVRRGVARIGDRVQFFRERVLMGVFRAAYLRLLRTTLRWRYISVSIFVSCVIVVFSLPAGGILPWVLFQEVDADTIVCEVDMSAGTGKETTGEVLDRIEAAAMSLDGVLKAFSVLGMQIDDQGQVQIADPETMGQVTVELAEADDRSRSSREIMSAWRDEVGLVPGSTRVAFRAIDGGPGGRDIEIEMRGEDVAMLQRAVEHVKEQLVGYVGVRDVEDNLQLGKLEARLELLPSARALGLTTRDLARQLRAAIQGLEAQRIQRGRDEVRVYVRLPEEARRTLGDLERVTVSTPAGNRVPLREVARLRTDRGYASLTRVDRVRTVEIKADVEEPLGNTQQISNDLATRLENLGDEFPGVSMRFAGRKKETADSVASLRVGFAVAMAMVYAIIAILFRSYIQPVIVMSVIPFAAVGAFIGHLIMNVPLTLLSLIGVVALVGIVVNDSLILVNAINVQRREGVPMREAVIEGGKMRLRPILLTSITTILGLSPLMLETSFQAQFLIPLAISIVYGLAFATLIVLLLIPCFYFILEDFRSLFRWLWTGQWSGEE